MPQGLLRRGGSRAGRTLTLWAAFAAGLLFALPGGEAAAQSKTAVSDGLVLRAEPDWDVAFGTVPFKIEIERDPKATSAPRDRTMTFVWSSETRYYRGRARFTVRETVVFPAADASLKKRVAVPAWTDWEPLRLTVYDGGSEIFGSDDFTWNDGRISEDSPSSLFVSLSGRTRKGPAWQELIGFAPNVVNGAFAGGNSAGIDYADLPDRVGLLAGVDVVVTPLADFLAARTKAPAQFAALRAWALSGGNLVVAGFGPDWEESAEVETALVGGAAPEDQWRTAAANDFNSVMQQFRAQAGRVYNYNNNANTELRKKFEDATWTDASPYQKQVRARNVGFGTLVAFQDRFRGNVRDEGAMLLFSLLGPERSCGAARLGTGVEGVSSTVAALDLQNIGKPPILSFQILITLFVLVIGPVNFFYLRKRNLTALTVVTVPLLGAAVTVAFLLFAFLSEGFSIRGRSRSFTQLTPAGDAVTWTRLSLYAGLAPSQGLNYGLDSTVWPLFYSPPSQADGERLTEWSDRQSYREGFLPSRTPVQFATARVRKSGMKVVVEESEGKVRARNDLGTPIVAFFLCDRAGKLHKTENLAAGTAASLDPVGPGGETWWKDAVVERQKLDVEADLYAGRARGFGYRGYFPQAAPPTSTGLLEGALGARTPAAGRWFAIVERSPEVEWGVDGVVEEDRLHVVGGEY